SVSILAVLTLSFFFFYRDGDYRDLHSFPTRRSSDLISESYLAGQKRAVQAVNTSLVKTYWEIGQHIVEFEQDGKETAEYGKRLRSEEHTSELQSRENLVCRLLLEKKNKQKYSLSDMI